MTITCCRDGWCTAVSTTTPFDAAFFHFLPGEQGDNGVWELPITGECSPALNYVELLRFLEASFRSGLVSGDELGAQLWAVLGQLAVVQRQKVLLRADPKRVLASEVLEFLRANYSQEVGSSTIAAGLGYSYSYLERIFVPASAAVSTRSCGGCESKVPRMPYKWASRSSTLRRRLVSMIITTSSRYSRRSWARPPARFRQHTAQLINP